MHVQLRPGLRCVWRGPQTLQIGLTPGRAAVLDGVTPDDALLIDALHTAGVDLAELDAGNIPPGAERGRELLRLLHREGVLLTSRTGRAALARLGEAREALASDAAAWALAAPGGGDGWDVVAARTDAVVVVQGHGRTASAVSACLAAAGVDVQVTTQGLVRPEEVSPMGPRRREVGKPRAQVARAAVDRLRRIPRPDQAGDPRGADVVVLVDHLVADAIAADAFHASRTPHLSVVIRETDIVVGPLVRPGRAPCLHCLDLHRSDRDPKWAHVLAQLLAGGRNGLVTAQALPEDAALSAIAGSLAALQVLAEIDARPTPAALGATLEVELPDGLVCHRPWPGHPSCGCAALPTRLPDGYDVSAFAESARGPGEAARMTS